MQQLFRDHIQSIQSQYEETLQLLGEKGIHIEAVLIHSGSGEVYFADDMEIPFRAHHHFLHWVPSNSPDQMVLFQPGKKPTYFEVIPPDFWYEQGSSLEDFVKDCFDVVPLSSSSQVLDHLPACRRIAFLGKNTAFAQTIGMPSGLVNERNLRNRLDYARSVKTPYEIACLKVANQRAVKGHEAAFGSFQDFSSEWQIHMAFLYATQATEHESPYNNIVALDEKAAILHYQHKRRADGQNSQVLLIDAGCMERFYCSDITRTYARDTAHACFRSLVKGVDQLQLDLVQKVQVGTPYTELHEAAHEGVLSLLTQHELVKGNPDELREKKISSLFFPHGTGHLLGLQVHDVSGHFKDETGVLAPPPEDHRFLRLTRKMEANMVFTIEPGLYFIPLLLDKERATEKGKFLNWSLIDTLTPLGGIRVEDNVQVTANGPVNLTR